MTDEQLLRAGMTVLGEKLGVVDFVRFLQLVRPGTGNWTEEREQLCGQEAVDAIRQQYGDLADGRTRQP